MVFPGLSPTVTLPGEQPSQVLPVSRSVSVGLFSDRPAAKGTYAWVKTPEGLGAGARVSLQFEPAGAKAAETQPAAQVTQKTYWGCGDRIPEGQPSSITPAVPAAAMLPDKSTAFWPGLKDKPLPDDAVAQGLYVLETNYVGATTITVGAEQEFLGPIRFITDPDKIALAGPIRIEWSPVPRAVGYLVTAFGGTKDCSVAWTSSSDPDAGYGVDERALSVDELKSLLERGVLLKSTSCTVPAGIFAGSTGAMISVTAFGPDVIQERNGVETRVIVRSSASIAVMAKKTE